MHVGKEVEAQIVGDTDRRGVHKEVAAQHESRAQEQEQGVNEKEGQDVAPTVGVVGIPGIVDGCAEQFGKDQGDERDDDGENEDGDELARVGLRVDAASLKSTHHVGVGVTVAFARHGLSADGITTGANLKRNPKKVPCKYKIRR